MGDARRRRSVAQLLTNLLTVRSPFNSCRVLSKETRPREVKSSLQALENYREGFRELTVAYHDTWWLLVRAENQAGGERLASARATRLAAHKASGGDADTFDASWSVEFNLFAMTKSGQHVSGTQLGTFWLGVRSVFCRSSASQSSRGSGVPTTVALRSLLVPGSLLLRPPQPLHPFATALTTEAQRRTHRTDYDVYKICREWSCSHDQCSDPCPRQLSHVCIRCHQPQRLASRPVQQKRKADRVTKDKSSWKCGAGVRMPHAAATPAGHSSLVAALFVSDLSLVRSSDSSAPCHSQQKQQQPVHLVEVSPGNAIAALLASVAIPVVNNGDGDADNLVGLTVVTSDNHFLATVDHPPDTFVVSTSSDSLVVDPRRQREGTATLLQRSKKKQIIDRFFEVIIASASVGRFYTVVHPVDSLLWSFTLATRVCLRHGTSVFVVDQYRVLPNAPSIQPSACAGRFRIEDVVSVCVERSGTLLLSLFALNHDAHELDLHNGNVFLIASVASRR